MTNKVFQIDFGIRDKCPVDVIEVLEKCIDRIGEVLHDASPEDRKAAYLTVFEFALNIANDLYPADLKLLLEEVSKFMNGASISSEGTDADRQSSTTTVSKAGTGKKIVDTVRKDAEQSRQNLCSGAILPCQGPSDSKTRLRGRRNTSSMDTDTLQMASPSTIPETQSSLMDNSSEPATLRTHSVRSATLGRPSRKRSLRQDLAHIKVMLPHPNKNGDTHKVLDRKDINDIDKIWKEMFAGNGVRRLNELIEQYNTGLRLGDGPESAACVEAAARDKDTPREAMPLLSVFARLIEADAPIRPELTSLRQHLDMLAFLQYYEELNEEVRTGSPRYNPTLAQGLQKKMTRGRSIASLVRDFLAEQIHPDRTEVDNCIARDRTKVDNCIASSRALCDMTDAFRSKGILCLAAGPMSCKLKKWGLNVMQGVWPLIKEHIPHTGHVCRLLERRIIAPIEEGKPIELNLPPTPGDNVYKHVKHLFAELPATRQGTKRKRLSQEGAADNSDQQSMIASTADGFDGAASRVDWISVS